jgi:hypothetical protein
METLLMVICDEAMIPLSKHSMLSGGKTKRIEPSLFFGWQNFFQHSLFFSRSENEQRQPSLSKL